MDKKEGFFGVFKGVVFVCYRYNYVFVFYVRKVRFVFVLYKNLNMVN